MTLSVFDMITNICCNSIDGTTSESWSTDNTERSAMTPPQRLLAPRLSNELPILIGELGVLVSADVHQMRQTERHLHGTVHYFISSALDNMRDVIDMKEELEGIALSCGVNVTVSLELHIRTKRLWKLRLDRPPSTT